MPTGKNARLALGGLASGRVVDFRIWPVSIETLLNALHAVASHPNSDVAALSTFAGLGDSTLAKANAVLGAFGLVSQGEVGFICTDPKIIRGTTLEMRRQILRKALLSYRPFESVCEGLGLGEPIGDAIRKASVLLGIKPGDVPRFQTLQKWGLELLLLQEKNGEVSLAPEITPVSPAPSMFITPGDVESEAKARLYVATRVGRDAYNALDEKERGLLADALIGISVKPSDAVEKVGQAVENYLRELCGQHGLASDAAKLNGGSQLASLLASKSLIHSHQVKLVDSVSMLRNAKAHHKDKKTLIPWHITEEGALASFFSAVTAIKSIDTYIRKGNQVL
jgi:hypothetical protein